MAADARACRSSPRSRAPPRTSAAREEDRRFRSMLIAMTDARVVLLKLAERVVDLEDADAFPRPAGAQRRPEGGDVRPLASRLGVWSLKARLEDACFCV